ncbi:hypothetical protein M076_4456 [Bacteroides fragilis str. 2-F-2 |uniref:Uncharacterized protein n=1 Tax=Bacteroides fragilis str. 2-F-2 \|nr:hypothetical protein M078_4610 [Bacteroides fragilis str. 2-F-2 \
MFYNSSGKDTQISPCLFTFRKHFIKNNLPFFPPIHIPGAKRQVVLQSVI